MEQPDFRTLLDTPTQLAEPSGDGPVVSEHPVAKLGRYRDPRYGKFAITREMYESWVRNLSEAQNGRVAIDYDHLAERSGGSTKAAGWITSLRLDGERVMARIEWTPEGAEAVRNRYYLFVSPSFVEHYKDESGTDRGPALLGVALTNRPFLQKGMPALSLSKEMEGAFAAPEGPVLVPGSGSGNAVTVTLTGDPTSYVLPLRVASGTGDSPARMLELTKIAEALSLSADADEDAILAAIAEATEEPEAPKTLAEQAEAEGKVVLDRDEIVALKAQAKAGQDAADQLFEQHFELAYSKALDEGRIDATEETKADWHSLYEAAPDVTLARIEKLPKLVQTSGRGSGTVLATDPEFEGENVDEEGAEIDAKAVALAKAEDIPYEDAVDRVLAEVGA